MPSQVAPMGGRSRPRQCRECGKRRADGHWVSKRGLCADCGERRQRAQCEQLNAGAGPMFDTWRDGMLDFADELRADAGA